MELLALPAFTDNYIWMIHDGIEALVVDPGDATPVKDALEHHGLKLTAILVTHHHSDHVGGLQSLQSGDVAVYGPLEESIAGVTHAVGHGNVIEWNRLRFSVVNVAGHTRGHLAYFAQNGLGELGEAPLAFVGDTLFSGGCGRVFEGSMPQMYRSLSAIATWPLETRLCPAHEYTLGNLTFASVVEPDNQAIQIYRATCEVLRSQGVPTLPTTLATELAVNPFLRCAEPSVQAAAILRGAADADPVSVFTALRVWKNAF